MTVTLDAARSLAAWGLAERGRGAMREEAWERGGGNSAEPTLCLTLSSESGVSMEKPIRMTCALEYASGRNRS